MATPQQPAPGHPPPAPADARQELDARGLLDPIKLRERLTRDNWTLDPLLTEINDTRPDPTKLPRADVADVVATVIEKDAARRHPSPGRVAAQQIGVLLVPLLLIAAGLAGVFRWATATPPTQPTVVSAGDLPPYHVIGEKDVTVRQRAVDPLALQSSTLVVGRYTRQAIARDQTIRAAHLRPADKVADLNARHIVTIPIRHVDATLAAALPAVVTLVFSDAKQGAAPVEERSVYLLAAVPEPEGDLSTGTVAVTTDALARIRPLLSGRDITVSWEAPR